MTLWIEWSIIDGDRIGFYIWNNLPDPTGTGQAVRIPQHHLPRVRGRREVLLRGRLLQPGRRRAGVPEWLTDGGKRDTPQDRSLRGIDGLESRAARRRASRARRSRPSSRSTASAPRSRWRPATGTSGRTSSPTTPTTANTTTATSAVGAEIRAWIKSVMQPFPTMEFPVSSRSDRRQPGERADPEHPARAGGRRRLLRLRRQHDPPLRRQREVELRGGRLLSGGGAGRRRPVDRRRRRAPSS